MIPANIKKQLMTDPKEFIKWVETVLNYPDKDFGFDVETNGLDVMYYDVVGFSIYAPHALSAIYVPLRHEDTQNIAILDIFDSLQLLFRKGRMIMHGSKFDNSYMIYEGFKLYKTICTLNMANRLQMKMTSLKDIVLEYRLVRFREIKKFASLMTDLGLDLEVDSFGQINMHKEETALTYVLNDSIWVYYAFKSMTETMNTRNEEFEGMVSLAEKVVAESSPPTAMILPDPSKMPMGVDGKPINPFV